MPTRLPVVDDELEYELLIRQPHEREARTIKAAPPEREGTELRSEALDGGRELRGRHPRHRCPHERHHVGCYPQCGLHHR